jgi:hypothetical protein
MANKVQINKLPNIRNLHKTWWSIEKPEKKACLVEEVTTNYSNM